MFFVAALVICLIIKFRFPKGKSIATIFFMVAILLLTKIPLIAYLEESIVWISLLTVTYLIIE